MDAAAGTLVANLRAIDEKRGRDPGTLGGGRRAPHALPAWRGGPPLLLVHGLLGYAFSWRFNLETLATQATVYAVDLLGVGGSERVPGLDGSLRASARRLLEFMEVAGIAAADVLGTSQGGALVMRMAALPEAAGRVRRLVLAAPVNPWSARGRILTRLLGGPVCGRLLPRVLPALAAVHRWQLRRLYGDPRRIAPGTLEGYSAPIMRPGTLEHIVRVLRCWNADLRELERELPRIADIPTLLLWGSKDRAVFPCSAERVKGCFRNVGLVVFDGVGHLPYEEVPSQFNQSLLRFLSASD